MRKWTLALLPLLLSALACGAADEDGAYQDSASGGPQPSPPNSGMGGPTSPSNPGPMQGAPIPGSGRVDGASGENPDDGEGPTGPVQPFVDAAHDPFSTFAADVDSASYEIFAKTIEEQSGLPPASQVRAEEFVNFFRYNYPEPDAATVPFTVELALGPVPTASTALLRIGIQGQDRLADVDGAHVVFLVDVSGSMSRDDKLPVAKKLLFDALDVLPPSDKVSIVTYGPTAQVVLPPTEVRNRIAIERVIRPLTASGSTAGADGIGLAYAQAEAGFVEGGINHIVLCTDGDFNLGPSTNDELIALIEQRRASGVTFTALGFGLGNLNDAMMEATSNAGNGIYRVISGPKTALRYVEQRMLSDIVHIAKDVKIQVEMNPDYVYAYRQIGYENRQLQDDEFRDDRVDAGEIGSGHQMTALYELALSQTDVPAAEGAPPLLAGEPVGGTREITDDDLLLVKLRYKAPGAAETDPASEIRWRLPARTSPAPLSDETSFAWSAATLASWLRRDPYLTPARLEAAEAILDRQSQGTMPTARREFRQLFTAARNRRR